MKKLLPVLILTICLMAGIIYIYTINQKAKEPGPDSAVAPTPTFAADVPVGEPITFEVKYRGITGKKDDLGVYSRWGFGRIEDDNSSFIKAVKDKAQHKIHISRNPYLTHCQLTPIEYTDDEILYAYFDLNADGQLGDNERLKPAELPGVNLGDNETAFLTPDFMLRTAAGQKFPLRVMLEVSFRGKESNRMPSVTWSPMGLYEGVFKLNGQKLRFYLFADFGSQGYMTFGKSNYSLVPADRKPSEWVPRRDLSSLIVHNKTFYRVCVQACETDSHKLFVSLAEDKSERGKVALKIKGNEEFTYRLNNANLQGAEDKTIHFTISGGMDELPAGKYVPSSGYILYDKNGSNNEGHKYRTSFRNGPAFVINAGKTTTVNIGKPEVKLQAVELKKRYHSDKKYKTEFAAGTNIYIDAAFVGLAGESYSSFRQQVQKDNNHTEEQLKARIKIVDGEHHEITNKELEYG